jgi:hypothetical protein
MSAAMLNLGAEAEQAAYELLRGAMFGYGGEVREAVQALPPDLSALPADLAEVLAGLRRMGRWNPAQVKPRIMARCPLAASAHDMTYPLERVKPIADFVRQIEAERLVSALKNALEGEGVEHPDTLARGRALLAVLEPPCASAEASIMGMARVLAVAKTA